MQVNFFRSEKVTASLLLTVTYKEALKFFYFFKVFLRIQDPINVR